MKNIFTTLFLFSTFLAFAQEATIITDKETYKVDEIVKVTFQLNAKYDSIILPDFKGFEPTGKPNKLVSMLKNKEGGKDVLSTLTFKLKPIKSGQIIIESPIYFVGETQIQGQPIQIEIDSSNLTAEEIEEKELQDLRERLFKPTGTTRIIFYENTGYIEISNSGAWKFHRRLTPKEIRQLNGLK